MKYQRNHQTTRYQSSLHKNEKDEDMGGWDDTEDDESENEREILQGCPEIWR